MDQISKNLAKYKKLCVVSFDRGLRIIEVNELFPDFFPAEAASPVGKPLIDWFPEFFGLEDGLDKVLQNKTNLLEIPHVNRQTSGPEMRYFHFLVLAAQELGYLFVEDVSDGARQLRMLNQQRYELLLYRNSRIFRKSFLCDSLLGNSGEIKNVRNIIEKLSNYPSASVLLLGESGTGKSLAARIIHYSSSLPEAPFVEVNCAALPENLIESELFGYEKGAFTHATSGKAGLLEEANGGSIFLDEIGELPIQLQAKLLSVIETKKFRRLGSVKTIEVDLRIITATNRNLESEVREKRFREDLFYRLNIVSITLPPLRKLKADVLLIAAHFLAVYNLEFKRRVKGFSEDARQALLKHDWPGNVRELSNYIERAMIFAEDDEITAADLNIRPAMKVDGDNPYLIPDEGIDLEALEKKLLTAALEKCNNNKTKAAKLLGLSRDTLRYRLEKHQLTIS